MKKILQIIALVILLTAIATWVATGANRGWTKTERPNGTLDEVTGIIDQTPVPCFKPGVDFLGAAFVASGIFAGASLFFRKSKTIQSTKK